MMRLTFWMAMVVACLASVGGWFLLDPPTAENVAGAVIVDWFRQQMIWAAAIGLVAGGIGGWWATSRLRVRPRQPSEAFFSRVAKAGLITGLVTGVLVILESALVAYAYAGVPISPVDRIWFLVLSGRFLAVVGLGVFASMLAFWAIVRIREWSGRYALQGV